MQKIKGVNEMLKDAKAYFEESTYIEHYDWYDGPLFYLMEYNKTYFACYMIDRGEEFEEEFVIPLNEDGVQDMKRSNIREWLWRQFSHGNLYKHKYSFLVGTNFYHSEKVVDISECYEGFPSINFEI